MTTSPYMLLKFCKKLLKKAWSEITVRFVFRSGCFVISFTLSNPFECNTSSNPSLVWNVCSNDWNIRSLIEVYEEKMLNFRLVLHIWLLIVLIMRKKCAFTSVLHLSGMISKLLTFEDLHSNILPGRISCVYACT